VLDGETGFLCRPRDALDLIEKLQQFIALTLGKRRIMGLRGRAFVEQNFDEKIVIGRYLEMVATVALECADEKDEKA
jgi:glycosyltransferase involved in cell wall biosynthesis